MAVASFDTLKFANTLKATGLPDKQAEALAYAFADLVQVNFKELVTKEEFDRGVKDLNLKIDGAVKELRTEIDRVAKDSKEALDQAVKELRREIGDNKTELKHEMQTMQTRHQADMQLLKWMIGVTLTGVIGALGLLARVMFLFPR